MVKPAFKGIGAPLSSLAKIQQPSGKNPLDGLALVLAEDLASVNALILEKMHSDVPMIPQLAGYLIAAGGKRIRPLMTLACAGLFGYQGNRHHALAACVEFIHTATLLHDDVVDDSDQRRGRASANAVFGNEAAVLVGDFLFSRSFELMVADGSLDVLRILSKASATIAEGEVLQLSNNCNLDIREEDYLRVITSKTAVLFAAACEVGGVVAGRSEAERRALYDYGLNLGIAFQMADDILDYGLSGQSLGKTVGDDFREGKMTLPVVMALQRATPDERQFWEQYFVDRQQADENGLVKAQSILTKHNLIAQGLEKARQYGQLAHQALAALPVPKTPLLQMLDDLIGFSIDRAH